jgi:hypothetical protein
VTGDFSDPTPERQRIVLIDSVTLQKAQRVIAGCDACSVRAEWPFENILDHLTRSDPAITKYVLEVAVRCLQCGGEITAKTLVEWNPE